MKIVALVVGLLGLAIVGFGAWKTLTEPAHLYAHSGEFGGCPPRPSCVSSVAAADAEHAIAAPPQRSLEQWAELISRAGGQIQRQTPTYLHAIFVTPTMRYHDDVEILRDERGLHWRSVSRFGYRDFGVNRERLEALRQAALAAN